MSDRIYNNGTWTKPRFQSFIKGILRSGSNRWGPKFTVKKKAWLRRGVYLCAGYNVEPHEAQAKDVAVDHIRPVIDPSIGFTTWDDLINNLFCEADNLQVLCKDCHKAKTADERAIRNKKNGSSDA